MKDYQRKKGNKYYLPKSKYDRVIALFRDYPYLIKEKEDLIEETNISDGLPKGKNNTSDPTAERALRVLAISDEITIIEKCLNDVPVEYRDAVYQNVVKGASAVELVASRKVICSERTIYYWRSKMLYELARKAGIIRKEY